MSGAMECAQAPAGSPHSAIAWAPATHAAQNGKGARAGFLRASTLRQQKAPPVGAGLGGAKLVARLEPGIQARHAGKHAGQAVGVNVRHLGDGRHLQLAGLPLHCLDRVGVGAVERHRNMGDAVLCEARRQAEAQGVVAADQILRAGHRDKAVAAKLGQDGLSNLHGHRANSSVARATASRVHAYTQSAHIMQAGFRVRAAGFSHATARPFPATRLHRQGCERHRAPIGAPCLPGAPAHRLGRAGSTGAQRGIRASGSGSCGLRHARDAKAPARIFGRADRRIGSRFLFGLESRNGHFGKAPIGPGLNGELHDVGFSLAAKGGAGRAAAQQSAARNVTGFLVGHAAPFGINGQIPIGLRATGVSQPLGGVSKGCGFKSGHRAISSIRRAIASAELVYTQGAHIAQAQNAHTQEKIA